MTPTEAKKVLIIVHKKRLLLERLGIQERAIFHLVNEAGEIRNELQNLENDHYRIMTRANV